MPDAAPPSTPPVLSAENLSVRFARTFAVRDVSLALASGDLLGLIGPNGAGKTTLLRALCALQPLTRGCVSVLGEQLSLGRPDLLARIGFTPDTPPVYDDLTVRQFLRFIGLGYGLAASDIEERADFWLERVWLSEKSGAKIKSLSRGMKQRLGIARTLLPNPAVILLDEPAAGLDPAGRVQFRQLLCELREQGKAIIVSSHILSDMADYCTSIGIMAAGQMVKLGTVSQVINMHNDQRCRYTLRLSQPVPGLEEAFLSIAGVAQVQIDRTTVGLEFSNDPAAAAALLAELIARKIPVCSFAPCAVDLEQAYLRIGIRQVD